MPLEPTPSFSSARKWSISLNTLVSSLTVLALVLMVNYLAARHFTRLYVSKGAQLQLSPLTLQVLASLTNDVEVIVYFDKQDPLYDSVWGLLKEYSLRNNRIKLRTVDYERDPGTANAIKATYQLSSDKDVVIFDCNKRAKFVPQGELSELDIQPLVSGQSKEVRRTHFKGELMFTSAILNVSSPRSVKAYFLTGHGEHSITDHESQMGYSKFAEVLKQNNIEPTRLSLLGTNEIPLGNLLILAGPTELLPELELNKIDQYLKNGGRMLALFNVLSIYKNKNTGLERVLADWGIEIGRNIVRDKSNSGTGSDIATSGFGNHPIVNAIFKAEGRLHMVEPRSIRKMSGRAVADAPNVTELAFTGPDGTVLTDIRGNEIYEHANDLRTNVSLAVAVEKGKIKNVSADRGTTRIVVLGDSVLWGNNMIESLSNRDFAFLAVNWLLDRSELLAIPARPIKEYKLMMTHSQLTAVTWMLLAGMPGSVLLLGLLVWVRRRP